MHTRSLRMPDEMAAWIAQEAKRLNLPAQALILVILATHIKKTQKAK